MHAHQVKRSRLIFLGFAACFAVGFLLVLPVTAFADSPAGNLQFIIVSDDLRKETTEVARPGDGDDSAPAAAAGEGAGGDGSGKTNHGHGNNADGVDSSNPGQGDGGPNGGVDPSGEVDDEEGGGGAAPSKDKGKKK